MGIISFICQRLLQIIVFVWKMNVKTEVPVIMFSCYDMEKVVGQDDLNFPPKSSLIYKLWIYHL